MKEFDFPDPYLHVSDLFFKLRFLNYQNAQFIYIIPY